jgi:hypothetical protein
MSKIPYELFPLILDRYTIYDESLQAAGIRPFIKCNRTVVNMMLVCRDWFAAISELRLGIKCVINIDNMFDFIILRRYNIVYISLVSWYHPRRTEYEVIPDKADIMRSENLRDMNINMYNKIKTLDKLEILNLTSAGRTLNRDAMDIISEMKILSLFIDIDVDRSGSQYNHDRYIHHLKLPDTLVHLYDGLGLFLFVDRQVGDSANIKVYVTNTINTNEDISRLRGVSDEYTYARRLLMDNPVIRRGIHIFTDKRCDVTNDEIREKYAFHRKYIGIMAL